MRLFLIIISVLFSASIGLSCASCGSGGDDPLILYPNEIWKLYAGITQQSYQKRIDENGEAQRETGPERRLQMNLSIGRQVSRRSFATILIPYISNYFQAEVKRGFGDPLATFRYTAVQQNLTEEYIPQIQLLASYRRGVSRSINETEDKHRLDVFGSGFTQYRAGIDIWSGMTAIQYGFAQTFGWSQPKRIGDIEVAPGVEYRSTLSLGQTWQGVWKYVLGINRLKVDRLKNNGETSDDSDQLNHSVFLTLDFNIDDASNFRSTFSQQAALFRNKNTSQSNSLTVAWMRHF